MLERDRPDLIVCADFIGDMRGREMFDIVRSDPSLAEIAFILLDGTEGIPDSKKDLELSWMSTASDVVRSARDLLALSNVATPSQKPAAEKLTASRAIPNVPSKTLNKEITPASRLGASRDTSMFQSDGGMKQRQVGASGTLEIFTLFDLAVSLTSNLKVGLLHIRISQDEGSIFFFKGRLTHAEFKGQIGDVALLSIFAFADEFKSDTEFIFEPLDLETLPTEVSSIQTPIDKLLFNVAVELDHQREARRSKIEERV
jgi:CheY-like chemotaxis protein